MIHTVSGSNFHGPYTIKLRGATDGFVLSDRQVHKVFDTLCGVSTCTCGGSLRYGDGPQTGTARILGVIVTGGNWELDLVPADSGETWPRADAVIA